MSAEAKAALGALEPARRMAHRQREELLVVQGMVLLAQEGVSRSTATQISERIDLEFDTNVTPSAVGVHLTKLKLETRISRGRSRFVLNLPDLLALHERLTADSERMAPFVEGIVERFADIAERAQQLEQRVGQIVQAFHREGEFKQYLQANRVKLQQAQHWEGEYDRARRQVQRIDQLKAAITDLEGKMSSLPDLEERRAALQTKISDHAAEEQALARREKAVKDRLAAHPQRTRQVRIAELDQAIEERQAEVATLDEQLQEKRGRLARLLGGQR